MCNACYAAIGTGLGMGVGQVLLCGDTRDEILKSIYGLD